MMMTVPDTATGMRTVLQAGTEDREQALRAFLEPQRGLYQYFPGEVDMLMAHRLSLGFPIDRDIDTCLQALEKLERADAWARVERALTEAVAVQTNATPGITVPEISFFLVLGDPGDSYFMETAQGLSGSGAVTGYILVTLWPTEQNLDRLEAAAVHELHHNLRYAPGGVVWDPATVTAGEHIVGEGVADAFARSLYGDARGYTPMGRAHLEDDAVFDKVVSGLSVTDMMTFAAWVHGDEAARKFGIDPVGLPAGAGYAVGNRLVDRYLAATGAAPSQTLHVPGQEIIDVALADR